VKIIHTHRDPLTQDMVITVHATFAELLNQGRTVDGLVFAHIRSDPRVKRLVLPSKRQLSRGVRRKHYRGMYYHWRTSWHSGRTW